MAGDIDVLAVDVMEETQRVVAKSAANIVHRGRSDAGIRPTVGAG